jgi:ABC-type multidrug transport system ATPase subunit
MELRIDQLTKTYPNGVRALDDLTLEIGTGMFGLLGPNGAGKSTLMRTIATLQQPDSGAITFAGINVLAQPMELRYQLGYLPQDFGVYPRMSADRLLDYLAHLKGVTSRKERKTLIDYCLEVTNLTAVRKKHVSGYSGGMKQRFGIAQLLLNKPRLIIVDEPTAGLDPAERQRFLNILREISTENIVIFSTHIVDDIKDLCTDMAIMNNGRLLQHTHPETAIADLVGQVWTTNISRELLPQMTANHLVLSSAYNRDNSLRVRVWSKEQPTADFVAATPNLEDVYFAALGQEEEQVYAEGMAMPRV